MALAIKDSETETLARQLAARTGKSLEAVIREALEEKLARLRTIGQEPSATGEAGALAARLMQIGRECAALPDLDTREADDILGYDEHGVPRS